MVISHTPSISALFTDPARSLRCAKFRHVMRKPQTLVSAVLIASSFGGSQLALAADKWFLLARHGECFPIRSLERKFPDIGGIAEPESFIKFVRAKGLKVDSKQVPVRTGAAVEVLVPERELALVFATAQHCSKIEAR